MAINEGIILQEGTTVLLGGVLKAVLMSGASVNLMSFEEEALEETAIQPSITSEVAGNFDSSATMPNGPVIPNEEQAVVAPEVVSSQPDVVENATQEIPIPTAPVENQSNLIETPITMPELSASETGLDIPAQPLQTPAEFTASIDVPREDLQQSDSNRSFNEMNEVVQVLKEMSARQAECLENITKKLTEMSEKLALIAGEQEELDKATSTVITPETPIQGQTPGIII